MANDPAQRPGATILVLSTPTWWGQASSVAQRVLEHRDAELSEIDESGPKLISGKVAIVAVVGNKNRAHKIIAECFQALNDVGFTTATNGSMYWNANIEQPSDYKDLSETPPRLASMMQTASANTTHLAAILDRARYPLVPAG